VLWQAIDAAQLLGAEPILVGIQPQVAAALSDLDVDMRSLIFQTDLRAGLMYAAAARPVPAPL
jgi:anti-anti-sigma regulatory factor